jgi:archaellum biogenesis ATPase FlaH/ribosomal protein L37AE/L43A
MKSQFSNGVSMKEFRKPREGEILSYLSRKAAGTKVYGDEIQFHPCPKCNKSNSKNPAGKINSKSGLWRCYACGATGGWYSLTKLFNDAIQDQYLEKEPYLPNVSLMNKYKQQVRRRITDGHYPELLEYCHGRGISNETLDMFRITTRGQYHIRFPLYDWVNDRWEIVNAKTRSIQDTGSKETFEFAGGATKILFGIHLIDYSCPKKRVIITEGQFDCLVGYEIGLRNIFSLPNGGTHIDCQKMMHHIPDDWKVWVCTDMDTTGDGAYEQFLVQLGYDRVKRMKLPHKDLNEWALIDPMISVEDIEGTINGDPLMDFNQQKFTTINFEVDYEAQRTLIAKTPWKPLNEILGGGLFAGQTTGLLAPSGAGKTSFCNHLCSFMADNKIDVGLISLEGTRTSLMSNLQGIIKHISDNPKETGAHLKISNLFGSAITIEKIIIEIREMISTGIKMIIVDNLDFICRTDHISKSNAYKEIIELATESAIHILSVWQPHKVDRKQVINSGNQKGFAQFYQDADNYWVLNKAKEGCTLSIEKNRENGIVDKTISFDFDTKNKIFKINDFKPKNTSNVINFLGIDYGNTRVSARDPSDSSSKNDQAEQIG